MFNKFTHILFNSSVLMPFILAIGISKTVIEKNIIIGIIAIVISFAIVIAQFIILKFAQKQMVPKKINILNVSQDKESSTLVIYITYVVPFAESCFGTSFTLGYWILVLIGALILILSCRTVNNPILKLKGYKIYYIETEHGVDMVLITRKEIRNRNSSSMVIRLFENYVMEA